MSLNSSLNLDERQWLMNVRKTLEEEVEEVEEDVPVCIFNVPKALISTNPDLYTPQLIAIGPYHHRRLELYDMERYKLAAARRTQKNLQCSLKFQNLVEQLVKIGSKIRACYHRYLDFSEETLAWMMAIDACFLLEFLDLYAIKEGSYTKNIKAFSRVSSRMSHLVDYEGRNSGHNAILRDIVMLENQIPMLILKKMLEFQYPSSETADYKLVSMIIGFCKEVSPLKAMDNQNFPMVDLSDHAHLLDFLFHMIMPQFEEPAESIITHDCSEEKCSDESNCMETFLRKLYNLFRELKRLIKNMLQSKPIKVVSKLPWTMMAILPGFAILKTPVESLLFSGEQQQTNLDNGFFSTNKAPLVEEIAIPSVTDLSKIGVRFLPTNSNITDLNFNIKTATFHLPKVVLDVNTEVILRNLVAYEASNPSGPLVFTRYTELMNGIIDTEEDVKLLREKGVILNHLKSDHDAARVWNGMSKSIRLTKVPFLDKVIEDVNKYYDGRWKVKIGRFMKHYVFASWQFLTLLAAVLLLFLVALQAFYLVYSCPAQSYHNKNMSVH